MSAIGNVGEAEARLKVCLVGEKLEWSALRKDSAGFRWECSSDTIELAANLVEPLLDGAGHQFLDVDGLAEQVMIARDEYAPDLH